MASLNLLAAEITHLLNEPDNYDLTVRVKLAFKHWRATFLRQRIEKYGLESQYIQRFVVQLQEVDKFDNCLVESECVAMRSINKIPTPISYPSDNPFSFVGTLHGTPFVMRNVVERKYASSLKWADKAIVYDYINQYIYTFNTKLEYIELQYLPEDPEAIVNVCDNTDCYDDDMEFPLPADLIQPIKTAILKEFGIIKPENPEVTNESSAS